jgi:hypothetical protein
MFSFYFRFCTHVPHGYRGTGTFIVYLNANQSNGVVCDLRRDANGLWNKPAGHSRYYITDPHSRDMVRVDRANKMLPSMSFDIQILQKRYEHPRSQHQFVRKIYTGRPQHAKPLELCCTMAVLTYFWKCAPFDFQAEDVDERPKGRPRRQPLIGQSISSSPNCTVVSEEQIVADEVDDDFDNDCQTVTFDAGSVNNVHSRLLSRKRKSNNADSLPRTPQRDFEVFLHFFFSF